MSKQPKIIILFGRSGCGKGTQAKLLIKDFGFEYIGTGDVLRQRIKKGDFTSNKLKKFLAKGERVPTPIAFKIWAKKVGEMKNKIDKKGLVVDGSPRSLLEAQLMDQAFDWYEWKDIRVILLNISEKEAFDRLTKRRICIQCGQLIPWTHDFRKIKLCNQCGGELETRSDDQPKAIRERLKYYRQDVQPAVDYYKKQKRLIRVDGEKPIQDVYREVKSRITL